MKLAVKSPVHVQDMKFNRFKIQYGRFDVRFTGTALNGKWY